MAPAVVSSQRKDFLDTVLGQLAAAFLSLIPPPSDHCQLSHSAMCCCCLLLQDLKKKKKRIKIYRQVRCALPPPSLPSSISTRLHSLCGSCFSAPSRGPGRLVRANVAAIFFQDGAGVRQEAERRGNAVRDGPFVVAFVAGVLPFSVKACCLILQAA